MRCFLTAAFLLMLSGSARADHSDDTLRYYLSKTELCIVGTIASEPIGVVDEAGVVNYTCHMAVLEVLAGELKGKAIHVNLIRRETGEEDRPPNLKKDAKCILFLKAQPRSVPPWATVDFWFGYQPYSSTLAGAIKRVAKAAEPPDARGVLGKVPGRKAAGLAGSWLMTLPLGAKHKVAWRTAGKDRFRLETATRFAGIYELRDDRLVMVKPADPAEQGFDWEVRGADELVLVTQRPGLEFDYLGTTLTRLKDDDEPKEEAKPKETTKPKDDGAAGPKRPTEGTSTVVGKAGPAWDDAAIDGGFMFRDAAEFQAYVAEAETVAVGTLATWDGSRGTLKVQKLSRGKGPADSLSLVYTGGTVVAKVGERVLALLTASKDGKLHSYCAASGLFRYSDSVASHVEKGLARRATAEDTSGDEAQAVQVLQEIKLGHRLRKEPAYAAPVQYCLLLLGREAKTRLWLASDGTTMYVDRNGNGDLTDPDEAIPYKNGFASLMPDTFPGHDGDGPYTGLHIAVRQRDWEKNTGGYWAVRTDVGSTYHMYAMVHKFARKPQDAPVVHLGGPLRMGLNHLYGQALLRGREVELEAYAACHYPGVERAYVDVDRRCPKDVHPLAEFRLPAAQGRESRLWRVPLTQRC
jgi:hypothetical protein